MTFNEYPYTDFHEMNLDWVIKKVKELAAAWAQVQQDWTDEQAAFANLQSWIENYFNNLNVQTEINVKLDAMVASGTMSELIAPYVTSGLPAEVAAQIGDVVALQIGPVVAAQIGAVVADQLPAIAASAAATEVGTWLSTHIDPDTGYVIDDSLTVQGAAADAKATGDEVTAIKSALTNIFPLSPNVINPDLMIANKAIKTSTEIGNVYELSSDNTYMTYLNIPVVSGETYRLGDRSRVLIIINAQGEILEKDTTIHYSSTTYTPSNSGFACVTFYTGDDAWFGDADDITGYVPYLFDYDHVDPDFIANVVQLDSTLEANGKPSNSKTVGDYLFKMIKKSPNMLNPSDIQDNKALDSTNGGHTSIIVDNNLYYTVTGIEVKNGQSYIIGQTSRIYHIVDSNNTILESSTVDKTEPRTINVTHDGYLAISFKKTEATPYVNPYSAGANYYPYGAYIPQEWLTDVIKNNSVDNILKGKTLYNFGDSVAAGDGNLVDGIYKGYGKLVAEYNSMTCNDYAHGGASMVYRSGYSCVYNQIVDAPATVPDFVLIAGGVNDLKFTTVGTFDEDYDYSDFTQSYIDNLDVTKFAGAFERVLFTAINKWTKSQIVYIFEHKMYSHLADGTKDLHDVALKICKKWSVPVLDMFVDGGLNLAIISELKAYGSTTTGTGIVIDGVTYDGTHPNGEGYRVYYVPKLTAMLKDVCPIYDAP